MQVEIQIHNKEIHFKQLMNDPLKGMSITDPHFFSRLFIFYKQMVCLFVCLNPFFRLPIGQLNKP